MQQMPVLQSSVAVVEGRLPRAVPSLPVIRPDRIRTAKALVEKAVKLRRVFLVQGPYPVIRAALWARGWVERRLPPQVQRAAHCHGDEEADGDDGEACADATERVDESEKEESRDDMCDIMSRLVRNETAYLFWTTRRDYIDCHSLRSDQMTNHYINAGTFTTKVGLCTNLQNLQWFDTADPDTFFPRCYRLGAVDEKQAFIEDFRRTACTNLLQFVVETNRSKEEGAKIPEPQAEICISENRHRLSSVGPDIIDRAIQVCEEILSVFEHGDIDMAAKTSTTVEQQKWAEFLQNYYSVVHEGVVIRGSSGFVERCRAMLTRLQGVCPQLATDGLNNIWIIKPGAKSRGRGIMCMNRLEDILALVETDRAFSKESKWVVQKYLERPLLVHGTKFDLRQWFLVTDWNPLTVWFYGECYLRFSTQPYTTNTLDSSVHLCNNSIQKHFQPSRHRHPGVPPDNMWSSSQFKAFLKQQGGGEAQWDAVVVPGMQQAVVHALQTAQDLVEPRKASFELYGADFMLGRDLRPWLLEINASPTMACSTAVTSRLCPAVQLDTLRVVLDWRTDPNAYTGDFKLIYKQAAVEVPHYVGMNLLVEGAAVRRPRPLLQRLPVQLPSVQTSPDDAEIPKAEPTRQRPHGTVAFRRSSKENRAVEEKTTNPTSSKRACDTQNTQSASCDRRPCQSLGSEQPAFSSINTKPRKKMQRVGLRLSANGTTLVPRSLSFSLGLPQRRELCNDQAARRSNASRSSLPPTASEPRHNKSSACVFPSLQAPLPSLEIFSLRPKMGEGAVSRQYPGSDPSVNKLRPHQQTRAKYSGGGAEGH